MTIGIKTKRTVNVIRKISDLLTGLSTLVLGYNDEWKFACIVMASGYILNKIAIIIESDAKIKNNEKI